MHPRISISAISTINWTVEQDLQLYRSAGATAASVLFSKLGSDVDAALAAFRDSGIRCSCVVAGGGVGTPLIGNPDGALSVLRPAIDAAAALGGPPCYFTSGATPERMTTDDAYAVLVRELGPVCEYGAQRGVRLGIENNSIATRDNGFIHTVADCVALSKDTGLGICLDLQNCWTESHLDRLFRDHVDRFIIVQVSDFCVGESLRFNRAVPGDGSMPLEWLLERLLDAGYQGLFDVEVLGPRIEDEGYPSAIARSVDWLSERLYAWGA